MPKGHYEHKNAIQMEGRHGDWTVLNRSDRLSPNTTYWRCRCVCGTERDVSGGTLRRRASAGCGCKANAQFAARLVKHGKSDSPEHRTWIAMRSRCNSPSNTKWNLYGAREITVDPRWDDFAVFLQDMGPKPSKRHSIERRDGNQGYSPENCYWATPTEQNRNTARNRFLTYEGETLTIAEWAERQEMSYGTLSGRIAQGWFAADALTIPTGRGQSRIERRRRVTIACTGDTGSL